MLTHLLLSPLVLHVHHQRWRKVELLFPPLVLERLPLGRASKLHQAVALLSSAVHSTVRNAERIGNSGDGTA